MTADSQVPVSVLAVLLALAVRLLVAEAEQALCGLWLQSFVVCSLAAVAKLSLLVADVLLLLLLTADVLLPLPTAVATKVGCFNNRLFV